MQRVDLTRQTALIGCLGIIASTFFAWSTGILNEPRRIYTYQPGPAPQHSLWNAAPGIAVLAVSAALIAVTLLLTSANRAWASAGTALSVLVVAATALGCWLWPPGAILSPGSGPGEPIAMIGVVLLGVANISRFIGSAPRRDLT